MQFCATQTYLLLSESIFTLEKEHYYDWETATA